MQNRDMLRCKMHELPQVIWPYIAANIPVCIYGLRGMGKSSVLNGPVFNLVRNHYGENSVRHDERFGRLMREDFTGIPNLNASKDTTVWTRPSIVYPDDGNMHFIILDEAGHAAMSIDVQHGMYGYVLERALGKFHLPAQNRIVLATNISDDEGSDGKFLLPLANRMAHILVELDQIAFVEQAKEWGWDFRLQTFLRLKPKFLHTAFMLADLPPDQKGVAKSRGPAEPTPRMWENVNKIMTHCTTIEQIRDLSIALVGERASNEFFEILRKIEAKLPPIEAILKDPARCRVPEDLDMQACIVDQIEVHAKANNAKGFGVYLNRMKPEIAAKCATNIVTRHPQLKEHFADLVT